MATTKLITGPDNLYSDNTDSIQWTADPVFEFATEVDALRTIQLLGEDLRTAREQVRQVTRYLQAAARAAHLGTTEDGPVQPQAIINESGVARATVYNWISDNIAR
ncbi:hypothetical protein [Nocardia cyriacigeorgica]|uniref:hypothetical protein n=1 Tax=Nocardia cyriacigeorgica TaxID=135487 RepID=UPI0018955148|nr:hypothetical protein [Nocardia cyriacigeorgica]MBF6416991.1 hypothetical protein [Nocardia cyriacigeorgica]